MLCPTETDTNDLLHRFARRGLEVLHINPLRGVLAPAGDDASERLRYYRLLKKYSFRLFLRDVIRHRERMRADDLQKYCSPAAVARYLAMLAAWNIIVPLGRDGYRLAPEHVYSFGDTFEWLIAQVLIREFYCPAAWGIRFTGTPRGGDYDVIAAVEQYLLYIETKSSPPKHIEQADIAAFLDRIEDLRPHFCIFLEDTHLRMHDKIAGLFQLELNRRCPRYGGTSRVVTRLSGEIFSIDEKIFISNSKPDLAANIGFCLKQYLRGRGIAPGYALPAGE